MRTLAIDIGGTKTAAAVVEDTGTEPEVIDHTIWSTPTDADQVLAAVIEKCGPLVGGAEVCGVSFGGPFDFPTQTCVRSMHVPGWAGVELSAQLSRAFGIPVTTDNDANVAALGEYAAATRQIATGTATGAPATGGCDPMLYVTVSTGVGAAIVVGGSLIRGAHSLAGELGHLPIGHDRVCSCGQSGCLERAVSGYWIERDHGVPAVEFLADDDNYAHWIGQLAQGLWSATTLIDPALIVLGGGMTAQGARLLDALTDDLTARAARGDRTPPTLRLGDPSGRTVLIGAAELAKEVTGGSR